MGLFKVHIHHLPDKVQIDSVYYYQSRNESVKKSSAWMLSRTQIVWVSFFILIPSAAFVLQFSQGQLQGEKNIVITELIATKERPREDPLLALLDNQKDWSSIIIHHLGETSGTIDRLEREHKRAGLDGFKHHFLIGNGKGLGDGVINGSARWAKGISGSMSNLSPSTISICLVGNGNRRPFTEKQLRQLTIFVKLLQKKYQIPQNQVVLASDINSDSPSPGQFFAEAQFKGQLIDIPLNN